MNKYLGNHGQVLDAINSWKWSWRHHMYNIILHFRIR
jgi:hypothetical protein